jgi:hypothetical protein
MMKFQSLVFYPVNKLSVKMIGCYSEEHLFICKKDENVCAMQYTTAIQGQKLDPRCAHRCFHI